MGTVNVTWGDGTSNAFTVADPPTDWALSKTHRYWGPGAFTINITGTDDGAGSTAVTIAPPNAPVISGTPNVQLNLSGLAVTFPKPAGLAAGDLIVAVMRGQLAGTADFACPAFTRAEPVFVPSDTQRVVGFYTHPVVDPLLEPASYTLARSTGTGRVLGALLVIKNAGNSPPAFAVGYSGDGVTTGTPQSRHTAAFAVAQNPALQLWMMGAEHTAGNSHVPVSTPVGFTEVLAATTDPSTAVSRTSLWIGKRDAVSDGAEGTLTTAGQ
jgi:hypothetical protein